MEFAVRKAKRSRRPLKIALEGLSGAGKTYTALRLAFAMRRAGVGTRIVVADSENSSADLYADVVQDGERWEYDTCPIPLAKQTPAGYAEAYEHLVGAGYDLVIIDSMSHAWHGAMEQVDAKARGSGDKFRAWADVTPAQRRMMQTLTDDRAHLIATMRVKSEYERVEGANGKDRIKKVGLKADQREGAEYEFDAVVRLDLGQAASVEKVRGCAAMNGRAATAPGPDFWQPLIGWWLSVESEADAMAAALRAAADLPALQAAFTAAYKAGQAGRLTAVEVATLTAIKEERKAALSAQAPTPPPPPPAAASPPPPPHPPADPEPDPDADDAAVRAHHAPRVEVAAGILTGGDVRKLISKFAEEAGVTARPLPSDLAGLKPGEVEALAGAAERAIRTDCFARLDKAAKVLSEGRYPPLIERYAAEIGADPGNLPNALIGLTVAQLHRLTLAAERDARAAKPAAKSGPKKAETPSFPTAEAPDLSALQG